VKPITEMSQAELGAYVQSHLRDHGLNVVLSGGAAVSIYSSNKYVSLDLDMIRSYSASMRSIRDAMGRIGFTESGSRYFKHPDCSHYVEFPPGPLTVGGEPVKDIHEIVYSTGILKVISPTDCVKDRLAAYYHFSDRQGLAQAIMVARDNDVNLDEVKRWSKVEGMLSQFDQFISELGS